MRRHGRVAMTEIAAWMRLTPVLVGQQIAHRASPSPEEKAVAMATQSHHGLT